MADNKPSYSLVPGDGGRASGLIRRRTAEESGCGFLDLSLGSIYSSPSSLADDDAFSPVDASGAVSSVVTAATAAYAPPVPASRASAFALGLADSAVPGDGNGGGHAFVLAANALAAANQDQVAPAPSVLPPLFASPVPVPVHGNSNASATVPAASDSGATRAPRSKGAVALLGVSPPSSVPPPPNRKAPRGRRGNATGRRRRSGAAGDDADAADAALTNGGERAAVSVGDQHRGRTPDARRAHRARIASVEGEVRCKRCDAGKSISYEIKAKFEELSGFIVRNVEAMHDRAPPEWMYPALPDCDKCGQKNSLRPVIAAKKWRINWMFLLLSQTLGLCTLEQLKHFCARTRQHRTGAKDRVLYSTYMELCNQLRPGGPFDMASERKNRTRPFA
ncbi:unnamed protein product [Miscanthus lutarioriparius]|uniref:DUF7086 domain-containing protein n=1 Tax=Miscanthus lutarioriparius TaxID=422564 RepID=A0A811RT23_9POAL|nr:unnamed protein product [Miscanthus lutarioriparius]